MSGDIAAASNAANGYLKTWNDGGRTQCLDQLVALSGQPGRIDDIREIIQCLINALIKQDDFKLSPDDLASLYGDLVLSQPSSSTSPEHLAIHQTLLDSISVIDDILEDRAMAREALAKEKDKDPSQKETKEKPKHRIIPERQPLVDFIRQLIMSNTLSQDLCALNLDYGLLQDIGVLRDSAQINGKEVRARTRLIYRQTKVNLLREQSEGYSKFIIELCNYLGPSQESLSSQSEASLIKNSQLVVDRLMKVAGYFDLDPTRMLDLVLDVFSTHLMTHYSFFMQLIRQFVGSRVRLLTGTDKFESMQTDQGQKFVGLDFENVLKTAEGTVFSMPSSVELKNPLAQLIGFKFAHYESTAQNLPQNLVFVAALLIREGLVPIQDFYDHLSPQGEGLDALRQKQEDEMRKRIRLAKTTAADKDNALASAPVLSQSDDRDFTSRRPPPSQTMQASVPVKPIKEPRILDELNQHRDLAIALLSVGALRPALFIITRHPWLTSRYPQLADIMLKHLEYSIDPVYRSLSPKTKDPDAAQVYNKPLRSAVDGKSQKTKLTMTFPVPPATGDTEQVFFFQQAMERIPVCQSADDLPFIVGPMMKIIGIHAYRHLPLFLKLGRIARDRYIDEASEETKTFWLAMLRVHFLPLVSMSKDNALLGMELWPILQKLEQQKRWSIYAEWLQKTYELTPEMRLKKALVTRECKGVLRRLSSKNQGQSARAFAKIAHHNPCVVFNIAIGQVMSYDNLADPLIEALRTLTPIGYDILTFCLLDAFSDPERPRMKDDGTNVSHWLQSLASLTAHLCRRYSLIDPAPILQFTVHRLYNDSPPDAIILRELISKMCGIEPLQMLADNQVAAMGGGPILQIETVASETRGALQTKPLQRSADKLLATMDTAGLLLPTLILLAQQSQKCVYQADGSDAILKGLSSMFDDLRGIFFQYVSFLSLSPISQKESSAHIRTKFFTDFPSLTDMVERYGLDPMMVIHICKTPIQRAIVEQAVAGNRASKSAMNVKEETPTEVEARLRAQIAATKENSVEEAAMQVDSENAKPWLPLLQPWIESVQSVLPSRVKEIMGAPFFVTFWQLTLFETVSLVGHYKEHLARITKLADDHARGEAVANKSSRDRSAWNEKKERLNSFKENLVKESNDHLVIYAATKKRLAQERLHWFDSADNREELVTYIIQYCLFPRALLSPMDADFAAQFIKVLHNLGTKNFWTVGCYNKVFSEQLGSVVFSCTQNEARNYGRFLRGVLRDLASWFKDEAVYSTDSKRNLSSLPGFTVKLSDSSVMGWTDYKRFVKKVHNKIASAMVACITGSHGEFMHVSNAIIVLKEILPVFPLGIINSSTGQFLDDALQKLLANEKRGDIKILATSYQGQLRMAKKEWETTTEQSVIGDPKSSTRVNGVPVGPKSSVTPNPSNATPARPPPRQSASSTPITHPLPANPALSRPTDSTPETKSLGRPPIIKRVNRDMPVNRDNDELPVAATLDASERSTSRLQPVEVADSIARSSPRPANGQTSGTPKEVPLGPRNPANRGHRLAEDPSSRPPPSASMPPPKGPSNTSSSQELRASITQSSDRNRPVATDKDILDNKSGSDARRPESSRAGDGSRGDLRRRSLSPGRLGAENGSDARKREDDRGGDRRSARDDHRRPERRPGREEDRDREKDRRSERDRDREGRRDRDASVRGTTSRGEDPSRTPGSPHRPDDISGRKRTRDPREEDPSDRNSKRPTRERDKEKERDRRDRSTREKEKDHRHRDRRRDRDETNSAGASPRDVDREGKGGPPATPSGPRAMINENDKNMLANVVRRERDVADTPPHRSQSSNLPPSGSSSSRGPRHRDDRGSDPFPPPASSLVSRIDSSLPPRPPQGTSRDNSDKLVDRDGQRKRTVSVRSQDETGTGGSSSKRPKIDRNR